MDGYFKLTSDISIKISGLKSAEISKVKKSGGRNHGVKH